MKKHKSLLAFNSMVSGVLIVTLVDTIVGGQAAFAVITTLLLMANIISAVHQWNQIPEE